MAYTVSNKTKRTFLITLMIVVLFVGFAGTCGNECISRNKDGVCLETVSDIGTVGSEIAESFSSDGSVSPFAGEHGSGICKTTGLNCD